MSQKKREGEECHCSTNEEGEDPAQNTCPLHGATKKILEKIRKLQRLATSDNVNEAAAAVAKIQELIDTYHIEEEVLRASQETSEEPTTPKIKVVNQVLHKFTGTKVFTWTLDLVNTLCNFNGVKCHFTKGFGSINAEIGGAGSAEDLEIVRVMASWLMLEVERLYQEEKPTGLGRGDGVAWANAFRNGTVRTIRDRLYRQQQTTRKRLENKARAEDLYRTAAEAGDTETVLALDRLGDLSRDEVQEEVSKLHAALPKSAGTALVRLSTAIATVDKRAEVAGEWTKKNMSLGKDTTSRTGASTIRGREETGAAGFGAGRKAGERADLEGHKRKKIGRDSSVKRGEKLELD